jgi:beta-lactam-binding protein with PASTA domain
MPDLTGLTLPQASSLVAASGLKVVSMTNAPARAPATSNLPNLFPNPNPQAATVVAQQPAPGSRVTPGTNVSLEVMHSL